MDCFMQVEEHHGSLEGCGPSIARFRRSVTASQIAFAIAVAAVASLALLLSFSIGSYSRASTLSDRLLAVASFVVSKKALFVLSNAIFLFLVADCCCCFGIDACTDGAAACEPGGVMAKQAHDHHEVVEQQRATQPSVSIPGPGGFYHKNNSIASEQDGEESRSKPGSSGNGTAPEEQGGTLASSTPELFRPEGEADNVTLETVVVVEAPTQELEKLEINELDKLEIDELNKKFDEFIQSRRIKWTEEEAYLLC